VAKIDKRIYGISIFDILLFIKAVSSFKNIDVINVPRQDIKARKLFFNPKKMIV